MHWHIVVEQRVLIEGTVVFGGERWRCEKYLKIIRRARPTARIEAVAVDPPVQAWFRSKSPPWPEPG